MGKIIGIVLLVVVAFVVLDQKQVIAWKNQATEKVNAAAKQNRLVDEATKKLAALQALANNPNLAKDINLKNQALDLIGSTTATLSEIKKSAEQKDLGAVVSNLINKVIPFNNSTPPANCPTPTTTQ